MRSALDKVCLFQLKATFTPIICAVCQACFFGDLYFKLRLGLVLVVSFIIGTKQSTWNNIDKVKLVIILLSGDY